MHPILLQTSFFTLHSLWFFFSIGLMAGTITLVKLAKKNNLKIQFITENSLKLLIFTLIGARIMAVIINYQVYLYEFSFSALSRIFFIWDKGLNSWGAILGFGIGFYIICKKKEQNFFKWMDIMVPSIIIILGISSLGAFFDGIHYGKETSLPWGVNFESPSIKYTVPIHPTQIYAFIYSLIIASALILVDQNTKIKNKFSDGIIALMGVSAFSLFKFLEEFLRGDDAWLIFGVRISQIFALIVLILTGIIFYLRYNKGNFNLKLKLFKNKKK